MVLELTNARQSGVESHIVFQETLEALYKTKVLEEHDNCLFLKSSFNERILNCSSSGRTKDAQGQVDEE